MGSELRVLIAEVFNKCLEQSCRSLRLSGLLLLGGLFSTLGLLFGFDVWSTLLDLDLLVVLLDI